MTLVKKGWTSPFSNNYLSDFFNTDKLFGDNFFTTERMPAVEVKDGLLSIFAERTDEKMEEEKNYTRKEFSCMSFSRLFTLPENVKDGEIDAAYVNGVLTIVIPKTSIAVAPVKKIEVK